MMFSATLSKDVRPVCKKFMQDPMEVYIDDEAKLTLHGLRQHYVKLKDSEKNRKLFELLDVLEFNQVVIFVKSVQRCVALAQLLIEQNFPAIAIHRGMTQEERLARYQQFKDFQKRILVATRILFWKSLNCWYLDSLSSWLIPLWMAMAGKFCSISSWARATHRWTDLTKITTWLNSSTSSSSKSFLFFSESFSLT